MVLVSMVSMVYGVSEYGARLSGIVCDYVYVCQCVYMRMLCVFCVFFLYVYVYVYVCGRMRFHTFAALHHRTYAALPLPQ